MRRIIQSAMWDGNIVLDLLQEVRAVFFQARNPTDLWLFGPESPPWLPADSKLQGVRKRSC